MFRLGVQFGSHIAFCSVQVQYIYLPGCSVPFLHDVVINCFSCPYTAFFFFNAILKVKSEQKLHCISWHDWDRQFATAHLLILCWWEINLRRSSETTGKSREIRRKTEELLNWLGLNEVLLPLD